MAAGPWADIFLAQALGKPATHKLLRSKGIHLIVPSMTKTDALTIAAGRRALLRSAVARPLHIGHDRHRISRRTGECWRQPHPTFPAFWISSTRIFPSAHLETVRRAAFLCWITSAGGRWFGRYLRHQPQSGIDRPFRQRWFEAGCSPLSAANGPPRAIWRRRRSICWSKKLGMRGRNCTTANGE